MMQNLISSNVTDIATGNSIGAWSLNLKNILFIYCYLCMQIWCPESCDLGYLNDNNGCTTCDCVPSPSDGVDCELMPTCSMYCPYGYRVDASGCPVSETVMRCV